MCDICGYSSCKKCGKPIRMAFAPDAKKTLNVHVASRI